MGFSHTNTEGLQNTGLKITNLYIPCNPEVLATKAFVTDWRLNWVQTTPPQVQAPVSLITGPDDFLLIADDGESCT